VGFNVSKFSFSPSWAGELETYLNVTEKQVLKQVQTCWSSLFTPRAIFYRFEKKTAQTKGLGRGGYSKNGAVGNFRHHLHGTPGNQR
jgi:hypothetical protein